MPKPTRWPRRWLATLAVTTAFSPAATLAQETAKPFAFVDVFEFGDAAPSNELRSVSVIGDERDWAGRADYPAEAIAAGRQGYVMVRVTVGPDDRVTDCALVHGTRSELQPLACKLIRERGHFLHALSTAGVPVAGTTNVEFSFLLRNVDQPLLPPPAPPPPPYYPYSPTLRMVREPDWRTFGSPGMPDGEIVVSLSLISAANGRPEEWDCSPIGYGYDKALEAATCAAVKAGEFVPTPETGGYRRYISTIQMLVRWKKGRASYQFPTRAYPTPVALDNESDAVNPSFPPGTVSQRMSVAITFGADRRARCRVLTSAGSDEADRRVCAVLEKLRFEPEIDIFGRTVPITRYYRYSPTPATPP